MLGSLAGLCDQLLVATGADRVTVRVDLPELGLDVDTVATEACRPGVASLAADSSIDQRTLETIRWLDRYRTMLVQDHFGDSPVPPPALIAVYGVRAQMLAPLESDGALIGWVSVHQSHPRAWGIEETHALGTHATAVSTLLAGSSPC